MAAYVILCNMTWLDIGIIGFGQINSNHYFLTCGATQTILCKL